jgi:hypothetical protein
LTVGKGKDKGKGKGKGFAQGRPFRQSTGESLNGDQIFVFSNFCVTLNITLRTDSFLGSKSKQESI